ncbi:MAG: hypothetical protein JWQ90_364 [Hydrocarboniphaga sp.]|nr:hypothetical protein [Hydrocarboniphaga sp.]
MKVSLLTVGLLPALLSPAAFAQGTPCGVAAPDPASALADETSKRKFVEEGKRYLRAAAYNVQNSGNPLCLDDVQKLTEPLNSQAFVDSLDLTPNDAKDLHQALQIIQKGAGKQRKQAEKRNLDLKQVGSAQDAVTGTTTGNSFVKSTNEKAEVARSTEASAGGAGATVGNFLGDGARYSIYAGPAYTLTPDGSWSSGVDTVFRSETAPKGAFRGYFQLSYTTRGGPKAEDGEPDDGAETEAGETAPEFVSPFDAKGGIVNIQTGGNWMPFSDPPYDWLGLSGRLGYESLPTEEGSSGLNTFKPFVSFGLVTRTIYTDQHSLGQIFLGYSRDYRWDKDLTGDSKNRYDRVVFSGLLELFQVEKATIATRLFASMPVTGKGDTEFRISILAGFKLEDIAQTLGSP